MTSTPPSSTKRVNKAEVYLKLAADARRRSSCGSGTATPTSSRTEPLYTRTPDSLVRPRFEETDMDDVHDCASPASAVHAAPVWDDSETPADYDSTMISPAAPDAGGADAAVPLESINRQLREELQLAHAAQDEMAIRVRKSEAAERAAKADAKQATELAGRLKTAVAGLQADLQKQFEQKLQQAVAARTVEVSELREELDLSSGATAILHDQLTRAQEQLADSQQEAQTAQHECAQMEMELNSSAQGLSAARQEMAALKASFLAALDEAKGDLAKAFEARKRDQAEAAELRFQAAEAEAARREAAAAAASALAELSAAQEEVAECYAQLAEREAALAAAEEALSVLAPEAVAAANEMEGERLADLALAGARGPPHGASAAWSNPAPRARDAGFSAPGDANGRPFPVRAHRSSSESTSEASGRDGGYGGFESKPMVERMADFAIEGASVDSILTNPALGITSLIDYVNEWRGAMRDISDTFDLTTSAEAENGGAGPVATPSWQTTPARATVTATISTPDLDH